MRSALFLLLLAAAASAQQSELWIDLSGSWRVRTGDRPEYAGAGFDDRAWDQIELPLGLQDPYGSLQALQRKVWLRKRVALPAWADREHVALTLGALEDVYEVYVNSQRIGATGSYETYEEAQVARPHTFDIPAAAISGSDELQIAIRLRRALSRPIWLKMTDLGPYVLTSSRAAPREASEQAAARHWLRDSPRLVFHTLMLGIALLAFLGWRTERTRYELLWFAIGCAVAGFNALYGAWMLTEDARPFTKSGVPLVELLTSVLRWPLFAEFAMAALGIRLWWIHAAIWLNWSSWLMLLVFDLRLDQIPPYFVNGSAVIAVVLVAVDWLRKGRLLEIEGHLLRMVSILVFVPRLFRSGQERSLFVGPIRFDTEDAGMLAVLVLILVLLFRRLAADRREKLRLSEELEAARAVQQLLLPSPHVAAQSFEVRAIYEPMQEVGGDFHWARAAEGGSLMVVVGDVSGKGLKAAMLVAVAVGILRNEKSTSPFAILAALNEGLTGNTGGGFVTCCCARFDPDGSVTIANAGHPVPYCDGREVECDAGLPLGVESGIEYVESTGRGSHFTFVSDGVVETANAKGELFGFERTRDISRQSAQEIADAAKAWGQNDDITVVTVRRAE